MSAVFLAEIAGHGGIVKNFAVTNAETGPEMPGGTLICRRGNSSYR